MKKRLRSEFALDRYDAAEASAKCPGETKCGKFQIAFNETGDGLDACNGCSMLPSKLAQNEEKVIDENHARLFNFVYNARARQKVSGEVPRLTTLQFELLVGLEFLTEQFEREAAAQTRIVQEENLKILSEMVKALCGFRKV